MDYINLENICDKYGCNYEKNFKLADKTTMKIGGECDLFVEPNSEECVAELLKVCRAENISYFILGRGSNVLIRGFHGVVIHIDIHIELCLETGSANEYTITAGAGTSLGHVCNSALYYSLAGMENLWGIPGSVGGALYMNAGAFGSEMKDVVKSARCIDKEGNIVEISAEEMELSYRHSVFSENGMVIISVTLGLTKGEKDEISARMREVTQKRRAKQPLEYPSCGSTFKRPQNGFAAALIEECGLKGYSIGGAQVSEKHSGFVINKGGATFEDVIRLVEHIKQTVREQKGVELECEMLIVDR